LCPYLIFSHGSFLGSSSWRTIVPSASAAPSRWVVAAARACSGAAHPVLRESELARERCRVLLTDACPRLHRRHGGSWDVINRLLELTQQHRRRARGRVPAVNTSATELHHPLRSPTEAIPKPSCHGATVPHPKRRLLPCC